MKSLLESILDDNILDQTDVMKDFPKRGRVGKSSWVSNPVYYYRWKNVIPTIQKIIDYSVLYISWYKDTENDNRYIIELSGSNTDFFNSQPIGIGTPFIYIKTNNEKEARHSAYNLLINIAANINILKYIMDFLDMNNRFHSYIDLEDIKKEFKNTWLMK